MTSLRGWGIYLLAAAVVVAIFIGAAETANLRGFPLDDAWIHQTYARNWLRTGEWAFLPGEPAAGSTAPLWSVLMAGGHFFGIDPVIWSAAIGVLALAGLGALGATTIRRLAPEKPAWPERAEDSSSIDRIACSQAAKPGSGDSVQNCLSRGSSCLRCSATRLIRKLPSDTPRRPGSQLLIE